MNYETCNIPSVICGLAASQVEAVKSDMGKEAAQATQLLSCCAGSGMAKPTLYPSTLNPRPLNQRPLNPSPLNPKPLRLRSLGCASGVKDLIMSHPCAIPIWNPSTKSVCQNPESLSPEPYKP